MLHITHNGEEVTHAFHQFLAGAVEEAQRHAVHQHRIATARSRPIARGGGPPPMQGVHSSCLRAVGYDGATRKLYLQFRHTLKTYTFYRVPGEVYGALMTASSKGRYYHSHIKDRYTHP